MPNAFDQFDGPTTSTQNPFDKFDGGAAPSAAPESPQPSQTLGFYEGLMKPLNNAADALQWGADKIGIADPINRFGEAIGLPSEQQAEANQQQYIASREKAGETPGGIGKFAGEVTGTLPVALATENPLAGGALTGGLLTDKESPAGILTDIALGGIGGKLGDLAVSGLSQAAKPVTTAIARKVGQWSGSTSPILRSAEDASNYVSNLLDTSGKTPADLRQAATDASGKPILAAEAIGRPGTAALTALGRRQGATPDALSGVLSERAANAPDRALADYATASGITPEAAQGDIDTLVNRGRATAKPLFDSALAAPGPIWNDNLRRLSQRPVIQKAVFGAADDLKNADLKPGVYGLPSGPDDQTLMPVASAWDAVKKRLGSMVERDAFGKVLPDTVSQGNYNINSANRALTSELKNAIPGYGDALTASGDYLGMQTAFQNGQKLIFNSNVTAKQMADHVASLSDAEAQAFKGGVANKLFNQAQNSQLKPIMFDRPILRQKMAAVLGPDNATTFLQNMKTEAAMAKSGTRMAPGTNSVTSDVLNATNEQDTDKLGAMMNGLYAGVHAAHGNGLGMAAHAMAGLRKLGAFGQTATMPVEVRDEAGRLLMMKPDELADYLGSLSASPGNASADRISRVLGTLRIPARVAGATAAANLSPAGPQPLN